VNFLNYVDRQILLPLIPDIQASLGIADWQAGLLVTAFMVVHSVTSVPIAIVADRWHRKWVIAIGVAVWSVATAAGAFTRTFGQLFAARAVVGIGEAAYAPAASAILAEEFPGPGRATAMGVFQLGMLVGGGVGFVLGGAIGAAFGWRAAFLVAGIPGLAVAALTLLIPQVREVTAARKQERPSYAELWRSTNFLLILLGGTLVTFSIGGILAWSPTFIQRYHGFSPAEAGTVVGLGGVVAGLLGVVTGAWLADRLSKRSAGARPIVAGAGFLLGVPFHLGLLVLEQRIAFLACVWLTIYFFAWFTGPILAAVVDEIRPALHATAVGTYLLVIHLGGDAISPPIIGAISDLTNLRTALITPVVAALLGGMVLVGAGIRKGRAVPVPLATG
jgi:MFS transporter, Spinster family, sphingosine-1-phosphate transporter